MITEGDTSNVGEEFLGVEPEPGNANQSEDSGLLNLIMRFLESTGNVLLVQGPPGTGKTTLALEVLRRMGGLRIGTRSLPPNRLYISSRVSPPRLRKHFPWINEIVDPISGKTSKTGLVEGVEDFKVSQADSLLSKILAMKQSMQRSIIVVDSWEGSLRNTTEEGRRMLESAILSEPDESRVGIVLISEGGRTQDLAHLVDGVVTLSLTELEGRRIRTLTVNKLRGLMVKTNQGLFTLDKGRFTILSNEELIDKTAIKPKIPEPIAHSENLFSTGSADFDKMLKGGVKKGSSLLLDLDNSVSGLEARLLLRIIVSNFVNQGGASIIVPSSTISSQNVADALGKCIGEKALEERVRIVEFNKSLPAKKWRLQVKSSLEDDAMTYGACWKELTKISASIALASDFDKIAQVYGEDLFLPGLADLGATIRDSGALNIGVASRRTKLRDDFLRTADYNIKMQSINGTLTLYGVKPFTNIYGATFTFPKGFPALELTQIV